MITDEQIRLFSQYCSENFGTELKSVRKSERYQSLPICVLDCVYSLRTKYFAVTVRSVYKELHADHETGAADNK